MIDLPENKKIILFDGVCNLCNAWVKFVIKYDKKDAFRFASIQSDIGIQIINHLKIDASKTDSIILFEPQNNYLIHSEAVFKITKLLGGFFLLLNIFSFLPKSSTDFVYRFVAKNRYNWFGKKDVCSIPSKENFSKFL